MQKHQHAKFNYFCKGSINQCLKKADNATQLKCLANQKLEFTGFRTTKPTLPPKNAFKF